MRRLLVLRPEPGASVSVERARSLGLDALAVPLFNVEPVEWQVPEAGSFDGLLLTSANAVRCGGEGLAELRKLKAYAVGAATAAAAREAGLDVAATGDAGVDRLLGSIDADLKLLHLCGADARAPVEGRQEIRPIVVYRAEPIASPDLSSAPGSVAMVHSPRAGRRLADLVTARKSIAIAAISAAAASAAGDGWDSVEAADQPSDEALLALAARLCNKPQPK